MEKAVTIQQLASCRRIFLLNAVRGMQQVRLFTRFQAAAKNNPQAYLGA